MAPKQTKKENPKKKFSLPFKTGRDPTLPASFPSTSREHTATLAAHKTVDEESCKKKCLKKIYDKEKKTCLGRTCKSWLYIVTYSIIYLIFLSTYTMIFLFATLTALKHMKDYKHIDKIELLTYSKHGIGLSATPTSENNYPIIWYKNGNENSYQRYIHALDRLLLSNRSNSDFTELGPCAEAPYGYASEPCVIIRINKQLNWAGKPLNSNSSLFANVPSEVKRWLKSSKKLWLHCDGYNSYDKEHLGRIKYYPYPPGFEPSLFPLDVRDKSPLIAIQISNFTQGISLAIQCNLWYEYGPSSIEFIFYVEPQDKLSMIRSSVKDSF